MINYLANPSRFSRISNLLLPWFLGITILLSIIGLFLSLIFSPEDIVQGSAVRIMYVHVPAAWMSILSYILLSISCIFFIIWRHPLADILARSIAPVGATFAVLTLITGSIWGRPMWGAWWVWDARLTSMLVLFLFFLGYLALSNAFDRNERGSRPAALLAIIGTINLPIVKFSVDWWNTLHQPASIIRSGGVSIDQSMLSPLIVMVLAFHFYLFSIVILKAQTILYERRIQHSKIFQER